MPQPAKTAHGRFGSERQLVCAAADGDAIACEALLHALGPQLAHVAHAYAHLPSVDRAELMQEAAVGVLMALRHYDCDRGPFWRYASWWVRQCMQTLVCEVTGPVVLSDRATRQLVRMKAARREHLQATRHEPSTAELAQRTGLSAEHVRCLRAVEGVVRTLDAPARRDDGSAPEILADQIPDPAAQDSYDRVLDQLLGDDVRRMPDRLEERERAVLRARYGLGQPPQTLREIAASLHLSAERVRQIEERALEHLREHVLAEGERLPAALPA